MVRWPGCCLDQRSLYPAQFAFSAHLDGPKSLFEDLPVEPIPLDHLEEVGVEGVEVGLDGGALHDEVLRQPGRELGRQLVLEERTY